MTPRHILFYDGTCRFCDRFVQLGLRYDRDRLWRYSPLQSEFATKALSAYGIHAGNLESIHAILNYDSAQPRLASSSDAGLLFWRTLHGWPQLVGALLSITPRFMREPLYSLVARNRYRWFGRYETCKLPNTEQAQLFILDAPQLPREGTTSDTHDPVAGTIP